MDSYSRRNFCLEQGQCKEKNTHTEPRYLRHANTTPKCQKSTLRSYFHLAGLFAYILLEKMCNAPSDIWQKFMVVINLYMYCMCISVYSPFLVY